MSNDPAYSLFQVRRLKSEPVLPSHENVAQLFPFESIPHCQWRQVDQKTLARNTQGGKVPWCGPSGEFGCMGKQRGILVNVVQK